MRAHLHLLQLSFPVWWFSRYLVELGVYSHALRRFITIVMYTWFAYSFVWALWQLGIHFTQAKFLVEYVVGKIEALLGPVVRSAVEGLHATLQSFSEAFLQSFTPAEVRGLLHLCLAFERTGGYCSL